MVLQRIRTSAGFFQTCEYVAYFLIAILFAAKKSKQHVSSSRTLLVKVLTKPSCADDGKSVTATIVDRCAGCAGKYDVDFTTAGFKKLASLNVGRIHGLQWEFV